MNNFPNCTLCLCPFDTIEHVPHILLCGHTFCSLCLSIIITQQKSYLHYLQCPLDHGIGANILDITKIPVNKIMIDMIDFSGGSMNSLSLAKPDPNEKNSQYLTGAKEKLNAYQKKFTEQYDIIYSTINNYIIQKNEAGKELVQIFDQIIHEITQQKAAMVNQIENYTQRKLKEMVEANKINERNKNIVNIDLKKINMLLSQKVKQITLSDQLMLLNELNLEILSNKDDNTKVEKVLWEISNAENFPKITIKNNIGYQLSQLIHCINVTFPNCSNEKLLNEELSKSVSTDPTSIFNRNTFINELNLTQINFDLSSLKISPEFFWFQPKSDAIFKFKKDKWQIQPNKSNFVFTEMFRVCQLTNYSFLITGGVINFQSSKDTLLYNTDGTITVKNPMLNERRAHGTCLIKDFVFVCGGINTQNESIPQCEKFSVSDDLWTPISDMPMSKSHLSICNVNNEKIFSFGGAFNEKLTNTIDVYDYETDIWMTLAVFLPVNVECPCVAQISKKEILICGGYTQERGCIKNVTKFNIDTFTFEDMRDLPKEGWCIYHPIFHSETLYIYLGGENSAPSYLEYKLNA